MKNNWKKITKIEEVKLDTPYGFEYNCQDTNPSYTRDNTIFVLTLAEDKSFVEGILYSNSESLRTDDNEFENRNHKYKNKYSYAYQWIIGNIKANSSIINRGDALKDAIREQLADYIPRIDFGFYTIIKSDFKQLEIL